MSTKIQPKMLKEFLGDSPNNYDSSNGFNSYPRTLPEYYYSDPNFQNLIHQATSTNNRLPRSRSRSRAAAEAAMSSFQKLLNSVKSIHYSSTPSPLPRSLSRRLLGKWQLKTKRKSNNNNNNNNNNSSSSLSSEVVSSKIVVVTVKVKDILRWRSFRDLVADHHHHHHHNHEVSEEEDESEPSDLVGPTDDAPSTSTRRVDTDFTVTEEEELPCYGNDDEEGKNWEEVVASDSEAGPKEVEDYHKIGSEGGTEQQSPVSVLNSPFRDEVSDEENLSTFDQSLANMERTKQRLLQSIQLFESLAGVHDDDDDDDNDEIEVPGEEQPREEDDTIKAKRKEYVSRGFRWFEKGGEGIKDKKECIQGMEKQGQWSKFEEERSEVGVELEFAVLDDLLDEVFFDLCG